MKLDEAAKSLDMLAHELPEMSRQRKAIYAVLAENERLEKLAEQRRQDRADALNVKSRDGLLSSEWLGLEIGMAADGVDERADLAAADETIRKLKAEVEQLRAKIAAALAIYEREATNAKAQWWEIAGDMVKALKGEEG